VIMACVFEMWSRPGQVYDRDEGEGVRAHFSASGVSWLLQVATP
jgi:hypothetical protein